MNDIEYIRETARAARAHAESLSEEPQSPVEMALRYIVDDLGQCVMELCDYIESALPAALERARREGACEQSRADYDTEVGQRD